MDTQALFTIIGELYSKLYQVTEENSKLKRALRDKEEALSLATQNGQGQPDTQRISNK